MTGIQGNGLNRRFAYTAGGERILEWDQFKYTLSLRGLGNEVLREVTYTYNPASSTWQVFWEKDNIWAGSRLLASVSRTQGVQHYHVDHLGSPRMVTNRCGQRVKLFDHNPWGLDRFASVQDPERHRFTAHQRDVGNPTRSWDDVDYMHVRYYTGYLGRMFSLDPVRGDVSSPQSFNLFSYVQGNPTSFVDPWGLMGEGAVAGGKKREDCKTDECVDVVAPNPCPDAPAGVSCEAWKAFKEMQLRMLLDPYRPTSAKRPWLSQFTNWIAANTDVGLSGSLYFWGGSLSLDQWGSTGKPGITFTTSYTVAAGLFVTLGPDRLRLGKRLEGLGFGWPPALRLPLSVEFLFGKDQPGFAGVVIYFGVGFYFPPGWVSDYGR